MADYCVICETPRPSGGTEILVVDGLEGPRWIEFCKCCEGTPLTNAATGQVTTCRQLFDKSLAMEVAA